MIMKIMYISIAHSGDQVKACSYFPFAFFTLIRHILTLFSNCQMEWLLLGLVMISCCDMRMSSRASCPAGSPWAGQLSPL